MTEMPTIVSEQVDDSPLLLAQMCRMDLPTLVDSYFVTHGNRHGLNLGCTVMVWPLAGFYMGKPKRVMAQPTAERLLEAFREITLTVLVTPQQTQRHLTPLTPLQRQILALLGFSSDVYHHIAPYSPQPP